MPSFNLTQAQYNSIAERLFYTFSKVLAVAELRKRFERTDHRLILENDTSNMFDNVSLSGVNIGTNTDASGLIYIRVVANASNWDINLYKATGGGAADLVASATNVASNTTGVTLSEQNNSGLSGSLDLNTGAADITDNLRISCYTDFPVRDIQVFKDATQEDAEIRTRLQQTNQTIVATLQSLENTLLQDAEFCLTRYVAQQDEMSTATRAINHATTNTNGVISSAVTGVLEDLREHMLTNTPAQSVVKADVTAGTPVFSSLNSGQGSITGLSLLENAQPGVVTLECVNETIGNEQFEVKHRDSEDNIVRRAANRLTINKEFKDPRIGIASMTLIRSLTKTGDASNVDLDAASSATVSGENSTNTNDGVLYWKTVANGSNADIEFYTSSSYDSSQLVAKASNVAANTTFVATEQNNSGLTVSWKTGTGPFAYTTGSLDLNTFRSGPPRDRITIDITRNSTGTIQKFVADYWQWYLNSAVSGSETLPDSYILRGGPVLENRNT